MWLAVSLALSLDVCVLRLLPVKLFSSSSVVCNALTSHYSIRAVQHTVNHIIF